MATHLPVLLENLRVAAPCKADWDEMSGDDRVRFCGGCEKNVYNLSAMTRADAEALVREREGRLCVRFYRRQDGTVLTADCPVGAQRRRVRQRLWASVCSVAASAALVLGLVTGRARADLSLRDGKKTAHPRPVPIMGGPIAPPPEMMGQLVAPAPPPKKKAPCPKTIEPEMIMGDISE
jgi:hypothetical protein